MEGPEFQKKSREPGALSQHERGALNEVLSEAGVVHIEDYAPPERREISRDAWQAAYEPPTPRREPAYAGEAEMKKRLQELVQLTEELSTKRKAKQQDPSSDES